MLLVDAGNLLHETLRLDEALRQREIDRGEMFVDTFNMMGWDAQGLGEKDLVGGLPRLRALAKRAKYPFLSANLVDARSDALLFTPRVIVQKAGVRIGLFSVMSPRFRENERILPEIGAKVTDPIVAAKEQVEALKKEGAQVFVALAMLDSGQADQLAKEVPQLTAVLGAQEGMMLRSPRAVGSTYLTDAFQKGKYLSALSLLIRKGETDFVFEDPNRRLSIERRIAELDARIKAREAAIADAKGDQARARNLQWLEQNLAQLQGERKAAQVELDHAGEVKQGRSLIAYDYPEMSKELADDPKVLARVDKLKAKYPELKEPRH
ncbi:MAG: hypothetical protein AMXMBFR64_44880 [Myxococcales bacterium]